MLNVFCTEHQKWDIQRTYSKHVELLRKGLQSQGCIRMPAMSFDANTCPPDMLHLKKGIISKLISQLVDWSVIQGRENVLLRQMRDNKIPFV